MTSWESNNYLDINLTSESSDSVLSSEDEELIVILRKMEKDLNYMVKFMVLAFITTRSDSPDVTDPVSHVARSLLFIADFDCSKNNIKTLQIQFLFPAGFFTQAIFLYKIIKK
jgi:hypothetical protein